MNPITDSEILSLHHVKIEIDVNNKQGVIILGNRRLTVSVLKEEKAITLEERLLRETAEKVAIILCKKELLKNHSQPFYCTINQQGITTSNGLITHEDQNQQKNTRLDYENLISFIPLLYIKKREKEKNKHSHDVTLASQSLKSTPKKVIDPIDIFSKPEHVIAKDIDESIEQAFLETEDSRTLETDLSKPVQGKADEASTPLPAKQLSSPGNESLQSSPPLSPTKAAAPSFRLSLWNRVSAPLIKADHWMRSTLGEGFE